MHLPVRSTISAAEHDALTEQRARDVGAAWAPHHPVIKGHAARYLGWCMVASPDTTDAKERDEDAKLR
jgi:hypothetical protein